MALIRASGEDVPHFHTAQFTSIPRQDLQGQQSGGADEGLCYLLSLLEEVASSGGVVRRYNGTR